MTHDCPWNMRQALRDDLRAYQLRPLQALGSAALLHTVGINFLYRPSHILASHGHPVLAQVLKALIFSLWSADISPRACLGEGLTVAHSSGIVVGGDVIMGKNCKLFSSVVLGGRDRTNTNGQVMPQIQDNVVIFTAAAVLGPVTVGSGASIGAHALVCANVPPHATVKGIWNGDSIG